MGFGEQWCNIWNCAFVVEDELVMIITELESKTRIMENKRGNNERFKISMNDAKMSQVNFHSFTLMPEMVKK